MIKVGFIGVGDISGIYLKNLTGTFRNVEVYAICDPIQEKIKHALETYSIPKTYSKMEDLLNDPNVDLVLNLTRPYEHYNVTKAALLAGKHVYTEKPLAANYEQGKELAALASQKGLLLGGAPDTFLGAGIQTCKKLIEAGFIGTPIGAQAAMICRGHESWHPNPEFYYQAGGGPMLDMGPYYLTALVTLLGNIKGITGLTRTSFPTRTITSQSKYGKIIPVEVSTYVTGILDFSSGAVGTLLTTFDVYDNNGSRFEIFGSEGSIKVPDPNTFGGPVLLLRKGDNEYKEIPLLTDFRENSRGYGLSEMADAVEGKLHHQANAQLTLHVLEAMTCFEQSSHEGRYITLESKAFY